MTKGVRLEDLPAHVRAQVDAALDRRPSRRGQSRKIVDRSPHAPLYRCAKPGCGFEARWTTAGDATPAAIARHEHGRFDLVPEPDPEARP